MSTSPVQKRRGRTPNVKPPPAHEEVFQNIVSGPKPAKQKRTVPILKGPVQSKRKEKPPKKVK